MEIDCKWKNQTIFSSSLLVAWENCQIAIRVGSPIEKIAYDVFILIYVLVAFRRP